MTDESDPDGPKELPRQILAWPKIDPAWRTSDVQAICAGMRASQRFDSMPILADALQDAGCDDEDYLAVLRTTAPSYEAGAVLTALAYSAESEQAVHWLTKMARDIGYAGDDPPTYTTASLVAIGHNGATKYRMQFWSDAGADFFRDSKENREAFFTNWALVTGRAKPTDDQIEEISYRCAC